MRQVNVKKFHKKKNKKNDKDFYRLMVDSDPKGSYAEAIKSVRTNLQFSSVNKKMKVILVTSPESGDGKSMTSANLAVAYAQEGKRVLIIDCDLRRGCQHKIFDVNRDNTSGYSDLILDYDKDIIYKNYIVKSGIKKLYILTCGPTPPNPIELLSSENNKNLLDKLKSKFDIIILDCPPVVGLSDALVLSKYSDANIVVVSSKKTKMESLKELKKAFDKVNSTITGVILNNVKQSRKSYYYYGE